MTSVFANYQSKAWPYRFEGSLRISVIAGGVPTDERVAENWLKTKAVGDDMAHGRAAGDRRISLAGLRPV